MHKIIDQDDDIVASATGNVTIRKTTEANYEFFLIYGRNVLAFFTYLTNEIVSENMAFEAFSPFPFENCSVRHSQVGNCDDRSSTTISSL